MKAFHSLHAKILLGYCIVGGLFILLVANSLYEFRTIRRELARQQQIVDFYDAVRHARRMEKNFLLYLKVTDLREALEKVDVALDLLADIRANAPWVSVETPESEFKSVRRYRELLKAVHDTSLGEALTQELLDDVFATGGGVIRLGQALDEGAKARVSGALDRHDSNLFRAIVSALALAVFAGILVTRSVVRPLRDIELSLLQVAKGERDRIQRQEGDREVESLTRSINKTIEGIEVRQETQARSSRLMALGTMLSGVAHELNNPLSNISSSCQILQEEWTELPPGQAQALLGKIDEQVLRAQRIVSGLLDFSRSPNLLRRLENVSGLVEEALQLVQSQLPLSVQVYLDISPDATIDVDRLRFQQVVVNIIKNAADAIVGEGSISIRAWRTQFPEPEGATLEIEDDGQGIPEECQRRIFDPFYTTKPLGKGTGLGLSVAHEIVTQHGGILTVESRPGEGARFWVHIPDSAEKTEHA